MPPETIAVVGLLLGILTFVWRLIASLDRRVNELSAELRSAEHRLTGYVIDALKDLSHVTGRLEGPPRCRPEGSSARRERTAAEGQREPAH